MKSIGFGRICVLALLVAFVLGSATIPALAQNLPYGTSSTRIVPDPLAASITPSATFSGAYYATGGVALRNRLTGNISVTGATGTVKAAYLYWAVITSGKTPPSTSSMIVLNLNTLAVLPLVLGTPVGSSSPPCWPGNFITVFKAALPLSFVSPNSGNNSYQVTPLFPAPSLTGGQDPWAVALPVPPLYEGASIVVIGTGTGKVDLFDAGYGGNTFTAPLSYSLTLSSSSQVLRWDNIGADGQLGTSVTADVSTSGETTTINGVPIAGDSANDPNSDWDGSSGWPLPQLWDDTGHDITAVGKTGTLNVAFGLNPLYTSGGLDCLTTVANVVLH